MLVRKIWNAKAAAKIERGDRMADSLRNAPRDFEPVRVLAHQNRVIENLRTNVKMQAANFDSIGSEQRIENGIDRFFVDAKWRRLAAHAHRSALHFGSGIDADGDMRALAKTPTDVNNALSLARRLDVNLADSVRKN